MDGLERFLSVGKGRHSQTAIVFPCKDEGHILQMLGCSGWKRLGKSDWKHQKSFPMNFYFLFFPECREVEMDGQKQFKKRGNCFNKILLRQQMYLCISSVLMTSPEWIKFSQSSTHCI